MLRRTLEMRHMYPVDGELRNSQDERVRRVLETDTVSKARTTTAPQGTPHPGHPQARGGSTRAPA